MTFEIVDDGRDLVRLSDLWGDFAPIEEMVDALPESDTAQTLCGMGNIYRDQIGTLDLMCGSASLAVLQSKHERIKQDLDGFGRVVAHLCRQSQRIERC